MAARRREIFGRLFYAIPTLPAEVIAFEGQKIRMPEQALGLLWLIDILHAERGFCTREDLVKTFERWWPPARSERRANISNTTKMLRDAKAIRSEPLDADRRYITVELTPLGRRLLAHLQTQRVAWLKRAAETIPNPAETWAALEVMAKALWSETATELAASATFEKKVSGEWQKRPKRPAASKHRGRKRGK